MEIKESSSKYTAFRNRDGHFQFKSVPFGLKNAQAAFGKMIKVALGNYEFVEVYLDDITIFSKTFEEHLVHILQVHKRLRVLGLKNKPSKCIWFFVKYPCLFT